MQRTRDAHAVDQARRGVQPQGLAHDGVEVGQAHERVVWQRDLLPLVLHTLIGGDSNLRFADLAAQTGLRLLFAREDPEDTGDGCCHCVTADQQGAVMKGQ